MNPGSSDSKNILPINQEVRRIYHHLCRHGGDEGAEKMILGETKPQPTFSSLLRALDLIIPILPTQPRS